MEAVEKRKEFEMEEEEKEKMRKHLEKLEPPKEKTYDEMTWPERAAKAAEKAKAKAIWDGASREEVLKVGKKASDAVLIQAAQAGHAEVAVPKRQKFDAAK